MATRQGKDGVVDLFKRIGAATVPFFGGLSGTFIPVSEDAEMGDAVRRGAPGYNRYLEMELHIEGEEGDALARTLGALPARRGNRQLFHRNDITGRSEGVFCARGWRPARQSARQQE